MKKFYELRMRDGSSIIASTNNEGFCRFHINGITFSIASENNGRNNFTFSIEKDLASGIEAVNLQVNPDLEVVSLQEVVIKKNAEIKFFIKDLIGLTNKRPELKRTFLRWKESFYFAKHSAGQPTIGMIYSQISYHSGRRSLMFL